MIRLIAVAAIGLLAAAAAAEQRPDRPYAGLQQRPVASLSAEKIADLRAGRGMGLALAAELNGYPGPAHVLELAEALHLSPAQRREIEAQHAAMRAEAVVLGERLITQEAALDRLFAARAATPEAVAAMTAGIGRTQGALRAAHLTYHIATLQVLSPGQVARYAELRGYAGPGATGHRQHPGRHAD